VRKNRPILVWAILGGLLSSPACGASALGSTDLTSRMRHLAPHDNKDIGPFKSWHWCIDEAETTRSDRDLKFFLSSSKLSDAKGWLVAHSVANEARFCEDISVCEQVFGETYEKENNPYPTCDQH
jgi:hypothetical protein